MFWFVGFTIVVLAVVGLGWYARRDGAEEVPPERRMSGDRLREILEQKGIDVDSTNTPNVESLAPHVAEDDDVVDAVQARRSGKMAVLVLFEDRLVVFEATLGQMGGELAEVSLDRIDDVDQDWDVGGEFGFEVGDEERLYTHVPRSQTRGFRDALRERLPEVESVVDE